MTNTNSSSMSDEDRKRAREYQQKLKDKVFGKDEVSGYPVGTDEVVPTSVLVKIKMRNYELTAELYPEGKAKIVGCDYCMSECISIPSTIKYEFKSYSEYKVTEICGGAFENIPCIQEIRIPRTVTCIQPNAIGNARIRISEN